MQPPGFLPSRPNFSKIFLMYVFGVKESNGYNEKILSLLHDLENQGQTPFCMIFLISGCKQYKVDLGVYSNIFKVVDIKYVEKIM